MNWYIYASNNPLRYVDPTGLATVDGQKNIPNEAINEKWVRTDNYDQLYNNDGTQYDKSQITGERPAHPGVAEMMIEPLSNEIDSLNESLASEKHDSGSAEETYKKSLRLDDKRTDLASIIPIDDNLLQTDFFLNKVANKYGNDGLKNPSRWGCAFMSSLYQVYNKIRKKPTRKEIVDFANSQHNKASTNFIGNKVLSDDFRVGDFYNLMNNLLDMNNSNFSVAASSMGKADFSLVKYSTIYNSGSGRHFIAGQKIGIKQYDPDPRVSVTGTNNTYYFEWRTK